MGRVLPYLGTVANLFRATIALFRATPFPGDAAREGGGEAEELPCQDRPFRGASSWPRMRGFTAEALILDVFDLHDRNRTQHSRFQGQLQPPRSKSQSRELEGRRVQENRFSTMTLVELLADLGQASLSVHRSDATLAVAVPSSISRVGSSW